MIFVGIEKGLKNIYSQLAKAHRQIYFFQIVETLRTAGFP